MSVVLIIILVLLVAGLTACGIFCVKSISLPNVWDRKHEFRVLRDDWGYDIEPFYSSVSDTVVPFEYKTSAGYTLKGEMIPAREDASFPDGRRHAVLLVHGYTCNRYTMMSYAEIYHRLGFDIAVYEHRFHGESDKLFCSMGYYESRDCVEIAEYVRGMLPPDTVWGIHGESMGSATTMLAAPNLGWMDFVCEDCGFTTLYKELVASIPYKANLPPHPLAEAAIPVFKIWRGVPVSKVSPVDAVKKIKQPMLFVHGGIDMFVPTKMVYELYKNKPGDNKMIHIFEDVPHAKSILMHHEEYYELVRDFLKRFSLI